MTINLVVMHDLLWCQLFPNFVRAFGILGAPGEGAYAKAWETGEKTSEPRRFALLILSDEGRYRALQPLSIRYYAPDLGHICSIVLIPSKRHGIYGLTVGD